MPATDPTDPTAIAERMATIASELEVLATRSNPTDADQARWEGLTSEFERLDANHQRWRIRRALDGGTTERAFGGPSDARSFSGDPWAMRGGALASSPTDVRGRALRAVELTEAPDGGRQAITEMVERAPAEHPDSTTAARWVLAVSDPLYRSAFGRLLHDPVNGHREFTTDELAAFQRAQIAVRALTVGEGVGVGLAAPYTLDPTWQDVAALEVDPVRRLARVVSIAGYEWRGVNVSGATAHWRAEAGETEDDSPSFTQPVIHPERYDCFVPFSFESQEDVGALEEELRSVMANRLANLQAAGWINGLGHANSPPQPQGIVTALDGGSSEVTPTTAEQFTKDDLVKLVKAIPARYRPTSSVIMDYATYLTARDFTPPGSTTDAPLFNDAEDRVGRPWYEASAMKSSDDITPSATADNHVAIAGDFAQGYTVVDRIGARYELWRTCSARRGDQPVSAAC